MQLPTNILSKYLYVHKNTFQNYSPHTHTCAQTTLKYSYTNALGHKYIPTYMQSEPPNEFCWYHEYIFRYLQLYSTTVIQTHTKIQVVSLLHKYTLDFSHILLR